MNRNTRFNGIASVAILVIAFVASPLAAQQLVTADSPEAILSVAQMYGGASMDTDSLGDPMIVGSISDINYVVYFYGCTKGLNCSSIQLRATWSIDHVSLEHINEWNRTTRFGKAYVEEDGDAAIEMEVNLDYGVTRDNLEDTFDWWRIGLTEYVDHLRER